MKVDCLLDYELIAAEQARDVNLFVRLKAPEIDQSKRKPLNLGLVIDRSGSMAGEKLRQTKEAIKLLIQHLGPQDLVSLVTFESGVTTVLAPGKVTNKDALRERVDRITQAGTTNLSGGWLKGIDHVAAHASEEYINRILLLTDGHANRGITDAAQLWAIGRSAREQYVITTTALGFGEDYNEDLLNGIAREAGGNSYYIESADMAPEIFTEELGDLLSLVAQNIEVLIRLRNPVDLVLQWTDHPAHADEGGILYNLGDAYSGETRSLLLGLYVPGLPDLGPAVIAETEVRYSEILEGSIQTKVISQEVSVNLADLSEAAAADPVVDVVQELGMQISAKARKEAILQADRGQFEMAREILRDAAFKLGELGPDNATFAKEREILEEQARELEYRTYRKSRKAMSSEAYNIQSGKMAKLQAARERKRRTRPDSKDGQSSLI